MTRHVVTLNAGSSSIKFALFEVGEDLTAVATGEVEMVGQQRRIEVREGTVASSHEATWTGTDMPFHTDALRRIFDWSRTTHVNVAAVGHRVVHGGPHYTSPVIVTDAVLRDLQALVPLAPLHEPHNIAGIKAAHEAWPNVPQVACFDTSFHRSHPLVNDVFALPRSYYDEGVRRYGFHGLSYEYIISRLRQIAPQDAAGKVVVAHLGNGASMCAIQAGQSVASTMSFTALDGLPMGTRCGQLDPAIVLYLLQDKQMTADQIIHLLYHESGLKGLSGLSHDMRELEASGRPEARVAIEYFVCRIRQELGGLAALLQGIDAIVFSAGIGEHSSLIRERVLEGLAWIGVELDRAANRAHAHIISSAGSRVRVFVIPTDEDAMIVRHTVDVAIRRA